MGLALALTVVVAILVLGIFSGSVKKLSANQGIGLFKKGNDYGTAQGTGTGTETGTVTVPVATYQSSQLPINIARDQGFTSNQQVIDAANDSIEEILKQPLLTPQHHMDLAKALVLRSYASQTNGKSARDNLNGYIDTNPKLKGLVGSNPPVIDILKFYDGKIRVGDKEINCLRGTRPLQAIDTNFLNTVYTNFK